MRLIRGLCAALFVLCVAKLAAAVDRLVNERWLTESDGRRLKAEVVVPTTASR